MVCMNVKLERILILHFHRWKIHCVQSVRTASLPIVNNNKIQIILPPPSACIPTIHAMSTFVISGSWVQRTSENLFILWTNHPLPFCPYSLFTQSQPFPLLLAKCLIFYWMTYSQAQNVTFSLSYRMLRISGSSGPRSTCSSSNHPLNQPYSNHAISDLCWRTVGSQKQSTLLHQMISSKCPKSMFSERLFQHLMHLFFIFFLYFINLKN